MFYNVYKLLIELQRWAEEDGVVSIGVFDFRNIIALIEYLAGESIQEIVGEEEDNE